jgi:hypothetical protein
VEIWPSLLEQVLVVTVVVSQLKAILYFLAVVVWEAFTWPLKRVLAIPVTLFCHQKGQQLLVEEPYTYEVAVVFKW